MRNEDYKPSALKQLKFLGLIGGDIHYTGYFTISNRRVKIANLMKYWKNGYQ